MLEIARSKFDSLTTAEQKILQTLGIVVKEPKVNISKSEVPRKIISVISSCRTCYSTITKNFIMRGTPECLTSEELPPGIALPPNLPTEIRIENLIRCGHCRQRLQLLSKEELIERILKL